ncbi:stage II sporulation protein D [Paenibacillus sp. FA6]|uniref:stage II sporulation protein D n=1 Tax=Paenibacillus sp. FA6 TaxID=3413029 RepID=UPI003F65CA2C
MKEQDQQMRIPMEPHNLSKVPSSASASIVESCDTTHPSTAPATPTLSRLAPDVDATASAMSRLAPTRRINAQRTRAARSRGFRRRTTKPPKWRIPPILLAMGGLLVMAMLLPVLVVSLRHNPPVSLPGPTEGAIPAPSPLNVLTVGAEEEEPQVSVYLTERGQIETLPLEDYVTGVVAAEMPADFAFESLKAQATAARTYIVQRLLTNDTSGVPVQGADVTDTVSHQAYISKETLEKEWKGQGKATQLATVQRAVLESRNIVMTYKGKPITATFFSTSNGYTENSEDYWQVAIPYLRSVSSPWDIEIAPFYKDTVKLSKEKFLNQMGLSKLAVATLKNKQGEYSLDSLIRILSTTQGNRIKELSIGGVTFSGREVREKLGLRSSQFSWADAGNDIVITTYGNGHGVGMSQWGANGMAQEGYTATQILEHYYTGIEFQQVTKLLAKK